MGCEQSTSRPAPKPPHGDGNTGPHARPHPHPPSGAGIGSADSVREATQPQEEEVLYPSMAITLKGVAMAHLSEGKLQKAEELYRLAVEVQEKTLGPDHPETAATLHLLADVLKQDMQYDEAEAVYKRVLSIRQAKLGPMHADTAAILNDLGELYLLTGRYPEAEPLFVQSRAASAQQSRAISRGLSPDPVHAIVQGLPTDTDIEHPTDTDIEHEDSTTGIRSPASE